MKDGRRKREDGKGARTDEGFDLAVDRAVREMLDVEPPADLRAKVIARIDERRTSGFRLTTDGFPFTVFGFGRFAALAVAAALLVLVVVLARRFEPSAPQPTATVAHAGDHPLPAETPIRTQPTMEGAAPGEQVAASAKNTAARAPGGLASGPSTGAASAASTDTDQGASSIDPLKAITPIEVSPIAQSNITPEPIAVRPLNPIAEVQVAPLTPPDRRD